ncbi:hypothetical protein TgHK011_006425 [Trichoderma gracile]|nr:hypothetical protein TgHK011_006425 [Trichoderma gracile]
MLTSLSSNQDNCAHQQRPHQGQNGGENSLLVCPHEVGENSKPKNVPYDQHSCSQGTKADTHSLAQSPTQQSNTTGIKEVWAGIVSRFIPGETQHKNQSSAVQQRRSSSPCELSHEPTARVREKASEDSGRTLRPRPVIEGTAAQETKKLHEPPQRHEEKSKQDVKKYREWIEILQERRKEDAARVRNLTKHTENMEAIVCSLRGDLSKAEDKVAALEKTVAENEAIIAKAHATAVTTLAGDVSRGLTDDMVREDLKKFFQTDFFSWCADLCVERIDYEALVAGEHKLLDAGVLNSNHHYRNGPECLKFNVNMPDGRSPLVLLQAVLASRLCGLFLSDAYFLAEEQPIGSDGRFMLSQLESHIIQSKHSIDPLWLTSSTH